MLTKLIMMKKTLNLIKVKTYRVLAKMKGRKKKTRNNNMITILMLWRELT